jgi:hypothetical protein
MAPSLRWGDVVKKMTRRRKVYFSSSRGISSTKLQGR